MTDEDFRIEHDSMGEVRVPKDAKWRAQTQRAVENFPISGATPRAGAHRGARPDQGRGRDRQRRARRARHATWPRRSSPPPTRSPAGDWDAHFPIDVFQTGSGTSSNMNANEVIATLATERLGRAVHPNDHVNASQSSNDVFPSSIHIAATSAVVNDLIPALRAPRRRRWRARPSEFADGGEERPHASDGRDPGHAGPGVRRLRRAGAPRRRAAARRRCRGWPSSRSAARPSAPASTPRRASRRAVIAEVARATGLPLTEARDHFEAQGARDGLVEMSGQLRTIAVVARPRSPTTSAGWAPARAPASPRSACPTCSRGRRSCRARSTR